MIGSAFRMIPLTIQSIEELNLPQVCKYFAERPRGLVLVTGPTGCGKTTSLAAMIRYINEREPTHIITIEDPIEFMHSDKLAAIEQRELGMDTHSFADALKHVMRQNPDVILVGEMRDLETIQLAITAAETGHLVFGTLHTTDAVQTVDRIIDVFPTFQQQQVRMQLSVNLVGVMSQILVKRADGQGRVAAFETLVAIPAIRNLIREAKTFQISSLIQTGSRSGMFTLDQYLGSLVKQRLVTAEEAMRKAQNTRELAWFVKAGMTPAQALGSATTIPAALLGREADLGTIRPGAFKTGIDAGITMRFDDIAARSHYYGRVLRLAKKRIPQEERRAGNPDDLAALIEKVLTVRRPRPAYRIHTNPQAAALNALPTRVIDRLLLTAFRRAR